MIMKRAPQNKTNWEYGSSPEQPRRRFWRLLGYCRVRAFLSAIVLLAFTLFTQPSLAQTPSQTNDVAKSASELKNMSLEDLFQIQVTSVSKSPKKLSETPSAIQVITSDDILRSGATSIPEALELASNLEVAQKNSHDWGITARGFNTDLANKLLVLMDGRSVYTPLFSGVFWDRQDYLLEDIDRIEVISGPGGSLWGANAVNGVINITTKSAQDTQGLYLEAGGGNQLQDFTGVRYGGMLATDVYYRVYGKYFDRGDEVLANGKDASDSWRMGQGGFRVDSVPPGESPPNHLTLQGDFYGGTENLEAGGSEWVSGGNVLGRWSHTFADDSDMSLQLYYDRTHITDPVQEFVIGTTVLAPAGTLTDNLDTYDIDFQDRFPVGDRDQIVWGLGYRFTRDVVENAPSLAFLPPVLDRNLYSGFVQDEIKLLENVHFTLGSKLEHNDYTGLEVEPSARLQWNVVTNHTLWTAVSRAVRTPSRIDTDLSEPAPPNIVVLEGGSNFVSETVIAYELGYRAQFTPKIATSLSGYYNHYDDVRSTSITPGTIIPFFFQNNLEGETYGFEFSGTYQALSWWRLRAGYNLLKEDIHVKPGKTDLNNALNETGDPEQQWSLHSSMDLPRNVELDAGLRWVDVVHNNNNGTVGTVPSYSELDVRLAWHPTEKIELSIVGQNLLHDHHPEFGAPGPDREQIVRSVYGKITCRF